MLQVTANGLLFWLCLDKWKIVVPWSGGVSFIDELDCFGGEMSWVEIGRITCLKLKCHVRSHECVLVLLGQ